MEGDRAGKACGESGEAEKEDEEREREKNREKRYGGNVIVDLRAVGRVKRARKAP